MIKGLNKKPSNCNVLLGLENYSFTWPNRALTLRITRVTTKVAAVR